MLYSEMSFIYTISSGLRSTVSVRESRPSYIRCNILSNEGSVPRGIAKNCSIRLMPVMPIFWVISTALVLHGVIISRRGPIKHPFTEVDFSGVAPSRSHMSFSVSSCVNLWSVCTA